MLRIESRAGWSKVPRVAEPPLTVLEVFQPADGGVPGHVAALAERLAAHGIETVLAGPADAVSRAMS